MKVTYSALPTCHLCSLDIRSLALAINVTLWLSRSRCIIDLPTQPPPHKTTKVKIIYCMNRSVLRLNFKAENAVRSATTACTPAHREMFSIIVYEIFF